MVRKSQKRLFSIAARDLDDLVRASAADLEMLRGRKLFVTGGTGFFGKWLLAALLHANAEMDLRLALTVLSRRPAEFQRRYPEETNAEGLRFLSGDVANFSPEPRRFDYLIHGAADTTAFTNETEESERSRAIVAGT